MNRLFCIRVTTQRNDHRQGDLLCLIMKTFAIYPCTNELRCYLFMSHYVYILRCRDGSLYTGYSTDPERRLKEHQEGKGARYTRGRRPVELLGFLEFDSRSEALSAEAAIKRYSPQKKLRVLTGKEDCPCCPYRQTT